MGTVLVNCSWQFWTKPDPQGSQRFMVVGFCVPKDASVQAPLGWEQDILPEHQTTSFWCNHPDVYSIVAAKAYGFVFDTDKPSAQLVGDCG